MPPLSETLPGIPPLGDFVQGYDASGWNGIGGPRNLPADIVNKLNTAVNAALADPKLKARFADLGQERFSVTPTDFGNFMSAETEKWAR